MFVVYLFIHLFMYLFLNLFIHSFFLKNPPHGHDLYPCPSHKTNRPLRLVDIWVFCPPAVGFSAHSTTRHPQRSGLLGHGARTTCRKCDQQVGTRDSRFCTSRVRLPACLRKGNSGHRPHFKTSSCCERAGPRRVAQSGLRTKAGGGA